MLFSYLKTERTKIQLMLFHYPESGILKGFSKRLGLRSVPELCSHMCFLFAFCGRLLE